MVGVQAHRQSINRQSIRECQRQRLVMDRLVIEDTEDGWHAEFVISSSFGIQ